MCRNMKALNQDSDNADNRNANNRIIRLGDSDRKNASPPRKMPQIPTRLQQKATLIKLTSVDIPSELRTTIIAYVPVPSIALKTVGHQ